MLKTQHQSCSGVRKHPPSFQHMEEITDGTKEHSPMLSFMTPHRLVFWRGVRDPMLTKYFSRQKKWWEVAWQYAVDHRGKGMFALGAPFWETVKLVYGHGHHFEEVLP